jgi:hypothetical protein
VISFWKGAAVVRERRGMDQRTAIEGGGLRERRRRGEPRLQSVAPAGKNYAFVAMLDASRELARRPSQRRVLVVLGHPRHRKRPARAHGEASKAMARAFAVPFVILMQPGGAMARSAAPTSGVQTSFDVRGYFEDDGAELRRGLLDRALEPGRLQHAQGGRGRPRLDVSRPL